MRRLSSNSNQYCDLVTHIFSFRKTSLLQQIKKPIAESNGFVSQICFDCHDTIISISIDVRTLTWPLKKVIRCCFDRTASPDTVIISAMNTFFGNLINSDNQCTKESIKSNIRETLGKHIE